MFLALSKTTHKTKYARGKDLQRAKQQTVGAEIIFLVCEGVEMQPDCFCSTKI